MRKLKLFIIPFFISAFIFCGCKKNMVEETYTPIVHPVTPDFTTKVNAAVNGFITDENGNAMEGATITAGTTTTTTDEFGYFKIDNASFSKSVGFIQVNKAGYFTGYRSFLPTEGKQTFIRLKLLPKATAGTIESATGGLVSTADGTTVSLPANAVVVASNNNPYSGIVNVAVHWYDPSDMQTTSLTMPGDLTGVDSAGHLNVLQTFGMLAVELTGNSGELLQIAPGKKASLHFPLPSSLQAAAPSYIPLWYFDETKGVWKQEGNAIKNGNSYDGEVSHFSFWNCDVGLPLVNFTAQLADTALNPLLNVPVSITATNLPNISRTAYTDTNGIVYGLVPANSNLTIDIITPPCNERITSNTISTANEPVDLGTIKVNLHQYAAVIEGTATKCNGSPVTDGYVVIAGFGSNTIINVTNGVFSAAGTICPGTNAAVIAYDRETSQRSDVQNVTLNGGISDVGNIPTCSVTGTEIITLTVGSGDPGDFTLPQYLFGGNFYFLNDSTSINAIDFLNGNQQVLQFSFTGQAVSGSYPLSDNSFMYRGFRTVFANPTMVNITSYGLVGEFITGSFSGLAQIATGGWQNLIINFNIQRDQ